MASSVKIKIHNAVVEGQRQLVAGLSIERQVPIFYLIGLAQAAIVWLRKGTSRCLLSQPAVALLARPMAIFCPPIVLLLLFIGEACWLGVNGPAHAGSYKNYTNLSFINKAVVLGINFATIMFHELCHAAAGFNRNRQRAEIRLGLAGGLPYCYTVIPAMAEMKARDKIAVSGAGIIGRLQLLSLP